jgi:hypothetical protein
LYVQKLSTFPTEKHVGDSPLLRSYVLYLGIITITPKAQQITQKHKSCYLNEFKEQTANEGWDYRHLYGFSHLIRPSAKGEKKDVTQMSTPTESG